MSNGVAVVHSLPAACQHVIKLAQKQPETAPPASSASEIDPPDTPQPRPMAPTPISARTGPGVDMGETVKKLFAVGTNTEPAEPEHSKQVTETQSAEVYIYA